MTIAVIAFTVLGIGSLGGSAYGQPSPPACPEGTTLDRGQCVACPEGTTLVGSECVGKPTKVCPEGTTINFETVRCEGKPGRPADAGNAP